MNNEEFSQIQNPNLTRTRTRRACSHCKRLKRRCVKISNQTCSECWGKRECIFPVCPICLRPNKDNTNNICAECLRTCTQQYFDMTSSLVNEEYIYECYEGYEGYEDSTP
ncbi:15022_t:CDS:2, partial [Racocetra persica]